MKTLKKHMSSWKVSNLMIAYLMTSVQFLVGRHSQQQKKTPTAEKNQNPTILDWFFFWWTEARRHFSYSHTLAIIWKCLFWDLIDPCLSMKKILRKLWCNLIKKEKKAINKLKECVWIQLSPIWILTEIVICILNNSKNILSAVICNFFKHRNAQIVAQWEALEIKILCFV